jgi:hypothetical protein
MPDYDSLALSGGPFPLGSTLAPSGDIRSDAVYPGFAAGVSASGSVFVDTETSSGRTGSLYGQAYSQGGAQLGPPVLLASNTELNGIAPVAYNVTALVGGGWATAWQRNENNSGGPNEQIEVGLLDARGALIKTLEFGSAYSFQSASVAALGDGGFVVEWGLAQKYSAGNTYVETFDANGNATSGLTTLSNQAGPVFATGLGSGGAYLLAAPMASGGVAIEVFDGAAFKQPVPLPSGASPEAGVALANGHVALVWNVTSSTGDTLYTQAFDPSANALVGTPQILDFNSSLQYQPHVIATADGGYVVSWHSPLYSDGSTAARAVGPSGSLGPATSVAGDLVGTFSTNHVLAVARDNAGHMTGQDYTIIPATAGSDASETLTANDTAGQPLAGGAGDDVLYAGHNSAILTGNGGGDTFVFQYLPWNAGQITDFAVGTDHLDLSALFKTSGYGGGDPIADGFVTLQSDGSGGTEVLYDPDGRAPGNTIQYRITDLQHLSPVGLTWAELSTGASGGSGGGGGGGSGGGSSGLVLAGGDSPQTLTGGSANDTITAGHSSDTITTGGGHDVVAFKYVPWNASHVSDFTVGVDRADFSQLLASQGYSGSDPVAAGYLSLVSDGHGGTEVLLDRDASGAVRSIPITVTDLQGVSPDGLAYSQLTNSGDSSGGGAGMVLTSSKYGDTLVGGPDNDTLNAGQGPDQLTGNGGADHFVFASLPWRAGDITDFTPGVDKIDLSALVSASYYRGSDPTGDGYLRLQSDSHGDTQVYWDSDGPSGPQYPTFITTLDHVATNDLRGGDFLFH